MPTRTSIEDAAMTGNSFNCHNLGESKLFDFSIGELDLAIADYSVALEIDSKSSQGSNMKNDLSGYNLKN